MFKILIDTCVWLDLVKDYQRQAVLGVLEELVRQNQVSIILPRTVLDEFSRNKSRVAEESGRSLSSVLKRAKEAVHWLGDAKKKRIVLEQLNDVDYKLPSLGDAAIESLGRIEKLFSTTTVVEASDEMKLRAAQRAIDRRAPFHRQRNSIDDAILIETYGDLVKSRKPGDRFAFVTHNTKDFSQPNANDKLPHPDMADCFSRITSRYYINLAEALRHVAPALVSDLMIEQEWEDEPRRLSDISDAIGELLDKVWYNRHQVRLEKIESGEIKLVEKETPADRRGPERTCQRDIWEGARKSARKVEKRYGPEKLGPWDDFEWGMLNGKLSALRWVLGDEWDSLDT
jgi:PIN domain